MVGLNADSFECVLIGLKISIVFRMYPYPAL